jgi:hypothetical protein
MPGRVHWHRVRIGLWVALVVVFAGVLLDSILSASWILDDGLLLMGAVVIALALALTRGRDRFQAE